MKLLRLNISLFLVCLLSVPALSVAAPILLEPEGFDLGWTVCRPFKEKANKKMQLSEDDFIAVYSKLKKPQGKRIPAEQAVPVYLQNATAIYNKSGKDVTYFYNQSGGYLILKNSFQDKKEVIKDIYSGLIPVYEIEIDMNNDGIKNRVWQYYYPYINSGGRTVGHIENIILDANNQLDVSFNWNTSYAWGQLLELNGKTYFVRLPFLPEALEEFDRGNYKFSPYTIAYDDDVRLKEIFNRIMSETLWSFLWIYKPGKFNEDPRRVDIKKCHFIIKLKPRRIK